MADGAFASGAGVGIYSRDGTTFTIHFLVNMQDGTQNLDEVYSMHIPVNLPMMWRFSSNS